MEVSRNGLAEFAKRFVTGLPEEAGTTAYVVGLKGELGAGKTAFVQEVAKALGITRSVTSPTFTLVQAYQIAHSPFERLVHIDAYRLKETDTDTIGWKSYYQDPANLILAEWSERVPGGLPKGTSILDFSVTSEDTRNIEETTS